MEKGCKGLALIQVYFQLERQIVNEGGMCLFEECLSRQVRKQSRVEVQELEEAGKEEKRGSSLTFGGFEGKGAGVNS